MHSGEIAVSSLSSLLHKAAATESQQQQHQHDSQQQGLRRQAEQHAQEGSVSEQLDRQQHAAVQLEIQEQQPHQGKDQQQQRQRMKDFAHQQREEIQQPQREGEQQQQQHQLLEKQRGIPGKQHSQGDERALPRGGFCRRRPARVASVRFNVPPCPTGVSATDPRAAPIDPVAHVRSEGASADSAFSATSSTSVSSTAERTDNADADTCSPWMLPLPVSASTATAGREDAAARVVAEEAAADAVEGGSGATGTSEAGPTDRLAAGESLCRAANAHVSRCGDSTAGGNGEPLRSSALCAAEEPPDSLAATRAQSKDKFRMCSSVESQTAGSPASPSDAGNDDKSAGGLKHAGTVGNGAAAPVAERGTARLFAASPPVRLSRVVAADDSETPIENPAAATQWNIAGAAVSSVGGEFKERRTSKVAGGCSSKRESVCNCRRTSESSVSSGGSEMQQYGEEQQHPRAKGLRAGRRLLVGQEVGSSSVQSRTSLQHEAAVLHPPSAVASVPPVDNDIRGIARSGASAEATAAICATALEAALAVDAAAAAAYPPTDLWAAAEDKAAALRRGRAHILVSSTRTTRTRSLVAAAEGDTTAATCGGVAAPNACVLAGSGNFSLPRVAGRSPRTPERQPPAEGRPLPPRATQDDAAQAADDALEYCSDWSTFRRSTGRCSIVNPGAAVSFIKTAAGAWCNLGNGGDTNTRNRGGEQPLRSSSGAVLPRCATEEITVQQQQRVSRDAAASSGLRRSCYLNAAAVHAAATADAAAHYPEKRDPATTGKESRVISVAALNGDREATTVQPRAALSGYSHASAIRDVEHSRRASSSSLQNSRQRCEADPAETGGLPDTTRNSTGRQLLSWWWGRRPRDSQQPLRPAESSQVLQRVQRQGYGQKQSSLQHQQRHPQRQDQEMLPLPSRHQQWGISPPAAGVKTLGRETGGLNGSKEDETELERLLELGVHSDFREKTDGEALQKEDLEAIVCNIQQVKNFLVGKLRECEAALLATAIERDDMEASLKELGKSLQQKEEQREAAVKQLQAENREKSNEVERLQEELRSLREREGAQQQQIQQLQDESVLLRADVHDRVAASALEQESLLAVIKQLEADKGALQEQVEQLQQALAKSRQQLASALSRVDELEAFAPAALCGEGSRRSTSSSSSSSQHSSSQCSSSSPTASASRLAVDSLRPTWWSVSNRESPQRPLQQHPRHVVQQGQQQHGQQRQVSGLAFNSLEVDTRSSRNSPDQCGSAPQVQRSSPEKALPMEGSTWGRSTAASIVLPPPAISTTLDMSYLLQQHRQQEEEEDTLQQSQWQKQSDQQQQQHDHQKLITACSAAQALEQLHASADAAAAAAQNSSSPKHTEAHRIEGDAVDEQQERNLTETHTEESGTATLSTPTQRSGATVAADSGAVGIGTVSHLAESGGEPRAAQPSRDATQEETVGHAEKIKEALAGGVTRVLQQLENVLTVEDRLIINESGVYTEDGVCLHKRGFTPSPAGLYAALWQQQEKHRHIAAQQQQDTQESRQQKQEHQGRKGSQRTADNRQADQASGLQRSPPSSKAECVCGSALSSDRSQSSDTKNLLFQRNSVSSSELEKERKKRDAAGPAPALSSEDLLVVLSEAEEDNSRNSKDDRSTPTAPKTKESAGRAARRGATTAGAAAVGSQRVRLQHQQQDQAKISSVSSNVPTRLSRSSSAALVGGTVRDAVCSVLQAVHQRAVEVYVHPSSVLPTVPAAGTATSTNAAESSVQLAGSTASSSNAALAAGDTAASGDAAAQRSRPLQQHQHYGAVQQSKSGRGRPSAWEHLLQRHREAQQMPLFGSTPYPGVTMSSSTRQGGSSSSSSHATSTTEGDTMPCYRRSSSNGSHKIGNSNEAGVVSTSDCPSSSPTDSEVATATHAASPAPGRQPVVVAHALQQQRARQGRNMKQKVEPVPRELAQVAQQKPPVEEHQQPHTQREHAEEGDQAGEAAFPPRQKDLPVQHTPAQGQVSETRVESRGNREMLRYEQGETVEYDVAKDARADVLETQQEEKVAMQRQIVNACAAARENCELQDREQKTLDRSQRKRGTPCESGFAEIAPQHDCEQHPTRVHEAAHRHLPEDEPQQLQQPLTEEDKPKRQDKVKGEEELKVGGGKEGEQGSIEEEQKQQLTSDRLKCRRGFIGEQLDDLCVDDTCRQRKEDEKKHSGKQQLETKHPEDMRKQFQDVKRQQDTHPQSQARNVVGDARKHCEAQAQQQQQHLQQQERTNQELKKKAEQTQPDTEQEVHPESGRRRQQQPTQQKAVQQRGKQQGQRRGGTTKTSAKQRRK